MKFTKPAWVIHHDAGEREHKKRLSIFSIHVHPDGSRIATGGLDAKIRIWSTKPILNEAAQQGSFPKSLSTLTMHTGPVLTVRWAYSGKWLASGSDDTVVMIWDLDPAGAGRVWGSDEVNVESWKALKRLPGHESDVTDLAWSPEDRYLASVGLDSMVIVWDGWTLQQLVRLDMHQGFVKGVCWDPVGEFLATQSDDKTVKIWRTTDWGLEASIDKPFRESPGSTFFRRLSWSPDGAHITASNAMNNKGAVFVAAVIARQTWTSEISLVGHENTVEVASYNPHIFLRSPEVLKNGSPVATSNICSVVALGADDRSVSVWQTKSARPLIVARNVFERQILDLSWSFDGLTLYACSSDGSIGVFDFSPEELEGIAPTSVQQQYLRKFGFVPPPSRTKLDYVHGVQQQQHEGVQLHAAVAQSQEDGFGQGVNGIGEVNKLVARRGKKRIKPTFLASLTSTAPDLTSFPQQPSISGPGHPGGLLMGHGYEQGYDASGNGIRLPAPPLQSVSMSGSGPGAGQHYPHMHHPQQSSHSQWAPPPVSYSQSQHGTSPYFGASVSHGMDSSRLDSVEDIIMGGSSMGGMPTIDAFGPDGKGTAKGKRKAGDLEGDAAKSKARTLGGDRVREIGPVRELTFVGDAGSSSAGGGTNIRGASAKEHVLAVPSVKTYLSVRVEGTEDVLEGTNSDDGRPTEVMLMSGKQTQWLDYLPSPVIALAATNVFCAAAMLDGTLNVYSHTGRKILLTLTLTAPVSFLEGARAYLMAIMASGDLSVWNVKTQTAAFPPTSMQPIFSKSDTTIVSVGIRPNGTPIINLSSGVVHSYDASLLSWVKVSEAWWADGSDVWTGRQRSSSTNASRGIIAILEAGISELKASGESDEEAAKENRHEVPQWWNTAKTLGHLEERQGAAKLLDSPAEFRHNLLLYAKKIADEGFRGKAEELVKELYGPIYWRPNKDDKWEPGVVGFSKRDLLKEVLTIFARSKTLAKLGMDWQDVLRRSHTEE